jgi:hypothetical protein
MWLSGCEENNNNNNTQPKLVTILELKQNTTMYLNQSIKTEGYLTPQNMISDYKGNLLPIAYPDDYDEEKKVPPGEYQFFGIFRYGIVPDFWSDFESYYLEIIDITPL